MNFRYRLARFLSGRYGIDTLFYLIFGVAAALSFLNCFLRNIYIQAAVYVLVVLAFLRVMSRNIAARQKENRPFANLSQKLKQKRETARARRSDYAHVYRKCPRCGAVLRLPRRVGKHKTVCPKCSAEFTVRVRK